MSSSLLTAAEAPSVIRRRGQAEVERLLDELRRRVGECNAETERLRWELAEAVKADLARSTG